MAYTFEQLALPYIQAKRLKRVLASFSPTFPGFYLGYQIIMGLSLLFLGRLDRAHR